MHFETSKSWRLCHVHRWPSSIERLFFLGVTLHANGEERVTEMESMGRGRRVLLTLDGNRANTRTPSCFVGSQRPELGARGWRDLGRVRVRSEASGRKEGDSQRVGHRRHARTTGRGAVGRPCHVFFAAPAHRGDTLIRSGLPHTHVDFRFLSPPPPKNTGSPPD